MHRKASEELCRAIVASTPDAVIAANQDGIITLWNGGAERIFGFLADEALGQSLDLIVPERLRPRPLGGVPPCDGHRPDAVRHRAVGGASHS